ncbi:hypothetical protein EYF80_009175 [Liparis tanakae]|uniref:Uncharacterized protein n=1 Tax=Liparis tanakae TaxID=230148 RepID=A0A4Z2ISD0_9TELE|nr:hypothetical protein EYF80_009175 [Liparis tanakae]
MLNPRATEALLLVQQGRQTPALSPPPVAHRMGELLAKYGRSGRTLCSRTSVAMSVMLLLTSRGSAFSSSDGGSKASNWERSRSAFM